MIKQLIAPITSTIEKVVDKIAPDAGTAEKLKYEITKELIKADTSVIESQVKAIVAEAQGEGILQRNWRPVTMLSFVALIGAHWLGLTSELIGEAEVLALLDIVKIGLGGYVVGRSAEKVMKEYRSKK